ncbi:MAG: hypothetical protein AAFP84_08145 [Actinomycetota bacterium]
MIDAFVEGARSIVQACHLVILFPVAATVLAARARLPVVAWSLAGIVLGGWVFATRWLVLDDTQIRWSSLVVVAGLLAIAVQQRLIGRRRNASSTPPRDESSVSSGDRASTSTDDSASTGSDSVEPPDDGAVTQRFTESDWVTLPAVVAGGVAFIATTWWRPCVGEHFGDILTRAPNDPWGQLAPSVGFMAGVSLPILLLGLLIGGLDPGTLVRRRLAIASAGVGVILAVSVLAGQHGEIVAKLFEWSEPFV